MRILSTKNFLIGSLAALSLVLAGCLTSEDDPEETAPVITAQPASDTAAVGDSVTFTVTATGAISYQWIKGTSDTIVGATSASLKVAATVALDGATYKCVVTNATGSTTSSAAVLTVTGLVWPTAKVDTLGAQGATKGSVLDLDSGKVWSSATANANVAKIDVVLLWYGGAGDTALSLNGANAARDSGVKYNINLTNGYSDAVAKDIMFVKVAAKPLSQDHAKFAYTAGTKVRSIRIASGDKFVVLSSENKYMYLEITAVNTTTVKNQSTSSVSFITGSLAL
jgi:hypothetical protein